MSLELTFPTTGAALVLGGSGGIGSDICRKLVQAGSGLAFTYFLNDTNALALERELMAPGRAISKHQLDMRDVGRVEQVVKDVVTLHGRLHTVIYAAGPKLVLQPLRAVSSEQLLEFLSSDVLGCFATFRAALPYLAAGGGGSLVACTTNANCRVVDTDALSAIPKAAIDSLIRQIASEEGINNIRANSVGLGWTNVGMGAIDGSAQSVLCESGVLSAIGAEDILKAKAQIRLGGRPATGEEAANAAVFLASDQAAFITGQTLRPDGGMSL